MGWVGARWNGEMVGDFDNEIRDHCLLPRILNKMDTLGLPPTQ